MITKLNQVIRSFFAKEHKEQCPQTSQHFFFNTSHENFGKFKKISFFSLPSIVLSTILVTLGLITIRENGYLQFLELVSYDQMVRVMPSEPSDPRLLIIGITEQDIQQQKQWPLTDAVLAKLLNQLQAYNPKLIGIDLYRDMPHPPGTETLKKALENDNVLLVKQLPYGDEPGINAPNNIPPDRVGFSDLPIDPDNVVRRTFLYSESPSKKIKEYSFALKIVFNYLSKNKKNLEVTSEKLIIESTEFNRLKRDSGGYNLPNSEATGWQILLNYRSRKIAKTLSLNEILTGQFDPNLVKDRIVLIGVVAPSEKDTFPTPYSATRTKNFETSGVEIHGQIVSQLLGTILDGEQPFWFWPEKIEWFWMGLWSLLAGIVVWRSQRLWILGVNVTISIIGLWLFSFLMLTQSGWVPFVPPLLSFLVAGTCVLAYKTVYQSYHDPLTGLPNRRNLERQLQHINSRNLLPDGQLVAVLFIDINRFKTINAGLGHEAGDYLLRVMSQRLQKHLESAENIGRVGGDEFAIYLESVKNKQAVITLAEELQQVLGQSLFWQGTEIYTTVTIGISLKETGKEFYGPQLLRYADIAMHKGKEINSSRPQVFEPGMDTQASQRWHLETDLRLGLDEGEFELYYQPVISLKSRKIIGFEALVRWNCTKRGFVSPGEFIPVAEETGLIIPLGEWILSEACRQIKDWHERFPKDLDLIMSVNLSGHQFSQPNLVEQIQTILNSTGVDGDRLKLEITESMMMHDVEGAIDVLNRLKGLGLRLSIDDFGTGYSSLSYLHRFPVDTLKVDQSFVRRMEDTKESYKYISIVRTIISLGHNLNLDVIAEGIETEEQMAILESLTCEYGQGYFFSRPLPREKAEALLSEDASDNYTSDF